MAGMRFQPGAPLRPVRILGTGSFLPPRVLSNKDLEKMVDTNDEWIVQRTGIRERRLVSDGLTNSEMGARAARLALDAANVRPEAINQVIMATITADHITPSCACLVQAKVGAVNAGAVDMGAACTGFIYALTNAVGQISSGLADTILVVGGEVMSSIVDFTDRNSCILFGDGAGAMVVQACAPDAPGRILDLYLAADGAQGGLITIPSGGSASPTTPATAAARQHYLIIKGREVFRFAVDRFRELTEAALQRAGATIRDVGMVIPHQVNMRVVEAALRHMDIPEEKIFMNIDRYGNTSAASVPIAVDEAVRSGRLKRGDLCILIAFGSGLTWGSATLRW